MSEPSALAQQIENQNGEFVGIEINGVRLEGSYKPKDKLNPQRKRTRPIITAEDAFCYVIRPANKENCKVLCGYKVTELPYMGNMLGFIFFNSEPEHVKNAKEISRVHGWQFRMCPNKEEDIRDEEEKREDKKKEIRFELKDKNKGELKLLADRFVEDKRALNSGITKLVDIIVEGELKLWEDKKNEH